MIHKRIFIDFGLCKNFNKIQEKKTKENLMIYKSKMLFTLRHIELRNKRKRKTHDVRVYKELSFNILYFKES